MGLTGVAQVLFRPPGSPIHGAAKRYGSIQHGARVVYHAHKAIRTRKDAKAPHRYAWVCDDGSHLLGGELLDGRDDVRRAGKLTHRFRDVDGLSALFAEVLKHRDIFCRQVDR